MSEFSVVIFYAYTPIQDPKATMDWLRNLCETCGVRGRFLLAEEGINGTFEGTREQIDLVTAAFHAQDGGEGTHADFSKIWFKESPGTGHAFPKLKIKVRPEIVTTGLSKEEDIDPAVCTGTHIDAQTLRAWITSGEPIKIVDMRNDYEYAVGHFAGSIESGMENFRDLKRIASDLAPLKEKRVVTVCTYGVRCEKASGYLKKQGFSDVYQLHGGIGTYMKAYPGEDFLGSLYVFDDRITEQFTDVYERIGRCVACQSTSERFGNCANIVCHKQLIICEMCAVAPVYCVGCEKKGVRS